MFIITELKYLITTTCSLISGWDRPKGFCYFYIFEPGDNMSFIHLIPEYMNNPVSENPNAD